MALTVTSYAPDYLTMHATIGHATKVTGPTGARSVRIQGDGVEVRWAYTGADASAMGNDYCSVPSGSAEWIPLDRVTCGSPPELYLGSDTSEGDVRIQYSRVQ